jgi:hypothetical protein
MKAAARRRRAVLRRRRRGDVVLPRAASLAAAIRRQQLDGAGWPEDFRTRVRARLEALFEQHGMGTGRAYVSKQEVYTAPINGAYWQDDVADAPRDPLALAERDHEEHMRSKDYSEGTGR